MWLPKDRFEWAAAGILAPAIFGTVAVGDALHGGSGTLIAVVVVSFALTWPRAALAAWLRQRSNNT